MPTPLSLSLLPVDPSLSLFRTHPDIMAHLSTNFVRLVRRLHKLCSPSFSVRSWRFNAVRHKLNCS
ncbi:hypothetical protein BVRB_007180 [Beta vulgaris subsp. vulgaris]|uniref:Uncharacterized protein n=1 Tax=Beta vulgaris subsp. vulgaris TaxID=3555 RepID=A0A0J8DXH9_BETVV|nr:hypothetical protein BVRB_007180 [Beta vulgaris subsp. vulgaris]